MYTALARFGYGVARAIRPGNLGKKLKPIYKKQEDKTIKTLLKEKTKFGTKSNQRAGVKLGALDLAGKTGRGYRSLYGATLGTSTRRKVSSGVLGGYTLGSMFDD